MLYVEIFNQKLRDYIVAARFDASVSIIFFLNCISSSVMGLKRVDLQGEGLLSKGLPCLVDKPVVAGVVLQSQVLLTK